MNILNFDLFSILPVVFLAGLSIVVLILEALIKKNAETSFWVSLFGLGIDIVLTVASLPQRGVPFGNMVNQGGYGSFFSILFLSAAFITAILSVPVLITIILINLNNLKQNKETPIPPPLFMKLNIGGVRMKNYNSADFNGFININ